MVDSTAQVKTFVDIMGLYTSTQTLYAIKAVEFEYRVSLKVAEAMVESYLNFYEIFKRKETDNA